MGTILTEQVMKTLPLSDSEARYNDYWMKNCELLQLELPQPLLPIAERVPSLPAAALADTEEKVQTETMSFKR